MRFAASARIASLSGLLALALAAPAFAQLLAAKDGPIVFGHAGLNSTSVGEHEKFWSTLGGAPVNPFGSGVMFQFPNIFVSPSHGHSPSGGTKGTSVNHIGFQVPNIRAMVDRVKAAGYPIVTRAELPAQIDVKDDLAFIADQNTYIAFVMGPDNIKVEFVENKSASRPIALHHIHFASPQVAEMKAWYVKVFSAVPGRRGSFEAADLPGVNLTFGGSTEPVVGTVGRVLDHITFEVKDLEAFCNKLDAMGIKLTKPYAKVEKMNLGVAFLTDPWGTSIELTEGFARIGTQ
jgi:catechol 2,3-dioxygenase-like lactoylglutathione lyase family enzyme